MLKHAASSHTLAFFAFILLGFHLSFFFYSTNNFRTLAGILTHTHVRTEIKFDSEVSEPIFIYTLFFWYLRFFVVACLDDWIKRFSSGFYFMNIITDMKCVDAKCHEIWHKLNVFSRRNETRVQSNWSTWMLWLNIYTCDQSSHRAANCWRCCRFPFQLFNQSFNGVSVTKWAWR